MKKAIISQSLLICPSCQHKTLETMPDNTCQWFYECVHCHTVLKPKAGDCCVFCSYGTIPCPSMQNK
ncbi:GDCCVxC domain-containing (seleno)protein [Psychromonas hadalis]|uniref:GDCCVxC domain-containing (seleno)protein n=1 Tax=Psychromonas hadalis TaxID=211669 RepID=UPI0003B70AFD|nr:GDCCVxC domain-containing (seleno)protein [Psychromonas hadalis]